jgi:hypothetical protein
VEVATHKAFAALDLPGQVALERDLLALANAHSTSKVGGLRIPREYLEVVATMAG